jgi:hypothetical protein
MIKLVCHGLMKTYLHFPHVLIQNHSPIKPDELLEELSFLHPKLNTIITRRKIIFFMMSVII